MLRRFNDLLALIVVLGIPVLLVGSRLLAVDLSGEAVGTFIGGWLLVIQFFFRKSEPKA